MAQQRCAATQTEKKASGAGHRRFYRGRRGGGRRWRWGDWKGGGTRFRRREGRRRRLLWRPRGCRVGRREGVRRVCLRSGEWRAASGEKKRKTKEREKSFAATL